MKFKLWETKRTVTTRTVRVLLIGCFVLLTIDLDFDPAVELSLDVTVGCWEGRRVQFSLGGVWLWYLAASKEHGTSGRFELNVQGPVVLIEGRG